MQFASVSNNVNFLKQKGGPASPSAGEDMKKILEDFVKEAFKTPEQRMKEAILKKHHLTEEDYDKLPKELHGAIAMKSRMRFKKRRVDGSTKPAARHCQRRFRPTPHLASIGVLDNGILETLGAALSA